MPRDVHAARRMPVSSCESRLGIGPLLVRADDELLAVAHRSAAQPQTRVVGVVDGDGRLIGVLPVLRIVEDVIARVDPEALLAGITEIEDVARFSHAVEARTARDAMLPPASIRPEATIGEAFRDMRRRHLSGLYVIDAERRVTGYLDLLELTLAYVDALEGADG
jgi:CBS domain-containing protein